MLPGWHCRLGKRHEVRIIRALEAQGPYEEIRACSYALVFEMNRGERQKSTARTSP